MWSILILYNLWCWYDIHTYSAILAVVCIHTCMALYAHVQTYMQTYKNIHMYVHAYIHTCNTYMRQRKEAPGPPVNKEECVEGGSWFHSAGPMKVKARTLSIAVFAVLQYIYMYICTNVHEYFNA